MKQDESLDFKEKIKSLIMEDIENSDKMTTGSETSKSDMKEMEREQPSFKIEVEAKSKDELIRKTLEAIKEFEKDGKFKEEVKEKI